MAEDLQKTWEERIEKGKTEHKQWFDKFRVETGRAYFEGDQNPGLPEDEWLTVNQIYTHLMAQLPTLYSIDPYFYVKVKRSHQIDPAKIQEFERRGKVRASHLNYLKVELELKTKARLGIQDAHFAYGILKIRRASDSKKHPQAGEAVVDEDGNAILDENGEAMEYPERIPTNERYELSRVHPDDLIFDDDAGPLESDWDWIAQHIQMTKGEALDDPRFKKADIKKLKGTAPNPTEEQSTSRIRQMMRRGGPNDDEMILDFWEIYNLKKREWLMIAEGGEKPVIKPKPTPPGIEKHPFALLRFTLRDKSPYPIPPVSPAIDPQKELSLTRSNRMTHRKRFNRKYEVEVDNLADEEELDKLESGDDGTIIRVEQTGAVNPIKDAPLDQQHIYEEGQLKLDITEVFGSPGSSRGIADADSATEAVVLDRRLEIREGDRLSMVADWLSTIARKMDMLVQQHIDGDEAVLITGPQGEVWETIRKSDYEEIQGEFQYSVNVGATQPRLPDIERAQWTAFLSQVVIPFPAILTKPSIVKRMAEMFHIEDEAAIQELIDLGNAIVNGALPAPGNQGGGPSNNPVAQILGMAGGPAGGNANGGGVNADL